MTSFRIIIIILCLLALPLRAATIYVATNGDDANHGNQYTPVLTIQHAADVAVAGDLIFVNAGTYNEVITTKTAGTSDNPIRFAASGTVNAYGFIIAHPWQTVEGFTLDGTGMGAGAGVITFNNGGNNFVGRSNNLIAVTAPQYLVLFDSAQTTTNTFWEANHFGETLNQGVTVFGKYHVFTNNTWGPATNGGDAVRLLGSNVRFSGNLFTNWSAFNAENENHPDLFQSFGYDTWATNNLWEGNKFINCVSQMGNISQGLTNQLIMVRDWTFQNNLFINVTYGFNVYAPEMKFYNNTFWRCATNSGPALNLNYSGRIYPLLSSDVNTNDNTLTVAGGIDWETSVKVRLDGTNLPAPLRSTYAQWFTFTNTAVNTTANTLTVSNQDWENLDMLLLGGTGTMPAPLVEGHYYWVTTTNGALDTSTMRMTNRATKFYYHTNVVENFANWQPIDLTDTGSGVTKVYRLDTIFYFTCVTGGAFDPSILSTTGAVTRLYHERIEDYNHLCETNWAIDLLTTGAGEMRISRQYPYGGNASNAVLLNNLFVECGGNPANPSQGWYGKEKYWTNLWADYNLVVGTGAGTTKTDFTESHGINGSDPLFVDAAGGDFRLLTNSPAIGSGINLSNLFTTSFDGFRTNWSRGAMEGTGAASTNEPPVTPGTTPTPTFSPASGSIFTNSLTVTLACSEPTAQIYWTASGTATTNSTLYTSITLTNSATISAIAVAPGMTAGATASATFTRYEAPTPEPEPPATNATGTVTFQILEVQRIERR